MRAPTSRSRPPSWPSTAMSRAPPGITRSPGPVGRTWPRSRPSSERVSTPTTTTMPTGSPRGRQGRLEWWFTGSGLPQRFSDETGAVLPIYQALTQWPDEWFADNSWTAAETVQIMKDMIAASESGYYSAFVNNVHPVRYNGGDDITNAWANALWAYAEAKGSRCGRRRSSGLRQCPRGIELRRPRMERDRAQLHILDTECGAAADAHGADHP